MTVDNGRVGVADRAAHEPSPSTGSRPDGEHPSRDLSDAAKCVCGGWFAKMHPGKGELTFNLGESKPRKWVVDALLELLGAGIVSVRPFNEYGGLVFVPLVDCHWAFVWMMKGGDRTPEAKLPLTEPIKSRRDASQFQRDFLALAAGTQRAETGATPAQSEGCQSGPKGNAQ